MFKAERDLQELVHLKPEIVLGGIPEISPDYCNDVPPVLSLGRETPLNSGPIDNIFIDANGILTLVECKRYCDSRLKRDVYSQAINYAADLHNMLHSFNGAAFIDEFFRIVSRSNDIGYKTFELVAALATAPILQTKDIDNWRTQFKDRLEFNIKSRLFRIIILCGPSPDSTFSVGPVRNLMQLMRFAEKENANYDLLLMDIRETLSDGYASKIIWRRYAPLPQIELFASMSRDNTRGIEAMKELRDVMAAKNKAAAASLMRLLNLLSENGYFVAENTSGLAIYRNDKKSIFTLIKIEETGWKIVRHQLRKGEPLYPHIEAKTLPQHLGGQQVKIISKQSSASGTAGVMYEIVITPDYDRLPSPELFQELSP